MGRTGRAASDYWYVFFLSFFLKTQHHLLSLSLASEPLESDPMRILLERRLLSMENSLEGQGSGWCPRFSVF